MRVLLIILLNFLICTVSIAQQNVFSKISSKKSRADKLFENFDYRGALNLYLEIYENDPVRMDIILQIAESYRKLNDPAQTASWYEKIVNNEQIASSEHFLYMAQALLSLQQYDKADFWLQKYKSSAGYDDYTFSKSFAYIEKLLTNQDKIIVELINLNTDKNELCPVIMDNAFVFMSNQENSNLVKRIDSWTHQPFNNLYYSDKYNHKYWGQPKTYKVSASKFNMGPIAFYNNGKAAVFTCNNDKPGKNQLKSLQLHFADVKKGKLQNLNAFPHNEQNSSMGHPAINQVGNLLIFSADVPGGYGGNDLYYSLNENGQWSLPKNLGNTINTAGDELFPYLHQDSILFFSSNGRTGIGGLDIFYCSLDQQVNPDTPVNPGYPLNSAYDDFGLAIYTTQTEGYFTSNRPGKGNDDIYYFQVLQIPVYLNISGEESVQLDIYENGLLKNSYADLSETLALKLIPGRNYQFKINHKGQDQVINIPVAGLQHINQEFNITSFGSL